MKNKLITFFKRNPGVALKAKQISKRLRIDSEYDYAALKSHLHDLVQEGFLIRVGKKFKQNIPDSDAPLMGKLEMHPSGYGFVILPKKRMSDIFIAARNLNTAFHGDTVEVILFAKQKRTERAKNLEGQIVRVVKRELKQISGTLQKSQSFYFVAPDLAEIHRDVYIAERYLNNAKPGDKVIAGNIVWENEKLNPEGEILEVLGKDGSIQIEILSLAREFNLPYEFPLQVLDEAEKFDTKIGDKERNRRLDYTEKNVFTIDPDDAKDFDDALSIEKLDNGNYSIGIHIADVSHYVKKDSQLDREAEKRGNSVYFVGAVIPMLPEVLSTDICSLVPYEDRLTYSVIVELTPRGRIVDYQIAKTIINSKKRFTYADAQEVLDKGKGEFSDELIRLDKVAKTLRKKRVKKGSINFFTPEVSFELDESGKPVAVTKREVKDSNMLVEEYMLLANKVIAQHIAKPKNEDKAKLFLYRIHDLPDAEKIQEFARFSSSLGYKFNPNTSNTSSEFNRVMEVVLGTPEEAVINELAIRSMAKAEYSPENIGHYGLGFDYYSHFTSPIRRYADLIAHRLLHRYIDLNQKANYTYKQMDDICDHISYTERNAVQAERQHVKNKQMEYLKPMIGHEFHGIISGVTNFGIFIKLSDILAEGLIHVRDLGGDYYIYDEKKYALVGRTTKKSYRLGDTLDVKLVRIDEEKGQVDFIIPD